jgi:hypothetical protein
MAPATRGRYGCTIHLEAAMRRLVTVLTLLIVLLSVIASLAGAFS